MLISRSSTLTGVPGVPDGRLAASLKRTFQCPYSFYCCLLPASDAGLPRGHLVRIHPQDDRDHSGVYRMLERLDRCAFLLEDANGIQVTTDASLHIVRSTWLLIANVPTGSL